MKALYESIQLVTEGKKEDKINDAAFGPKVAKKCTGCGKHHSSVRKRLDPYMYEINHKKVYKMWCDNCDYEAARDI